MYTSTEIYVKGAGSRDLSIIILAKTLTASLSGSLFSPFPPSERTILSTVPCSVQYKDGGWRGVWTCGMGYSVGVREGVGWGEV